jgi:formate hydrogenlyase transcriptional activator
MVTSAPDPKVDESCGRRFEQIIGSSTALEAVLAKVERVAPTGSTVLIEGETGTGKELIARAIHNLSPRCGRPFVKVNCAAIPLDLLESELFGHGKGAFTGAIAQRIGRFEMADEGTLFLDEIGDIPPALQPKLLRVLQEREFERLGSSRTHSADVRVVAATNRNLLEMVAEKRFRDDLYYRLNVFPNAMPPLRERQEDIPALVTHFVDIFSRRIGKSIDRIPPQTMRAFTSYPWPGNIRELQNLVERGVIMSNDGMLPNPFPVPAPQPVRPGSVRGLRNVVERAVPGIADLELPSLEAVTAPVPDDAAKRRQIEDALHASRGRVSGVDGAAQALGVAPGTLESRIQRLRIDKYAFRRRSPNGLFPPPSALGAVVNLAVSPDGTRMP